MHNAQHKCGANNLLFDQGATHFDLEPLVGIGDIVSTRRVTATSCNLGAKSCHPDDSMTHQRLLDRSYTMSHLNQSRVTQCRIYGDIMSPGNN